MKAVIHWLIKPTLSHVGILFYTLALMCGGNWLGFLFLLATLATLVAPDILGYHTTRSDK